MPRVSKPKRRELVYTGSINHDGSLVHLYYFVTDSGDLEDKAQVYPQALGDFPIGAVCSYAVEAGGGVRTEGAMFTRVWPDAKVVEEWTARHNATAASEAAWASKDLPVAFQCLDPVRAAYRRLDEERQGVLIAQVVRYLVTPDDQ